MTLLINPIFWVVTIAVYFLLLTRFPGSLTFRFGLFNLIALYILVGWETTLGVTGDESVEAVQQTTDGGYIICGGSELNFNYGENIIYTFNK